MKNKIHKVFQGNLFSKLTDSAADDSKAIENVLKELDKIKAEIVRLSDEINGAIDELNTLAGHVLPGFFDSKKTFEEIYKIKRCSNPEEISKLTHGDMLTCPVDNGSSFMALQATFFMDEDNVWFVDCLTCGGQHPLGEMLS